MATSKNIRLKAIVDKLAGGEFRVQYLHDIYLGLRDTYFGREWFKDIGDFIAHTDERDKGLTPAALSNFAHATRFIMRAVTQKAPLNASREEVVNALEAQVNWVGEAKLASDLNIRYDALKTIKGRLIKNVGDIVDGIIISKNGKEFSEKEKVLYEHIMKHMIVKPAMTDASIYEDFIHVLERNQIISNSESLEYLKYILPRYVASKMHMAEVIIGPDDICKIEMYSDSENISVKAHVPFKVRPVDFVFEFINTSTKLNGSEVQFTKDDGWPFHVELKDDGLLHALH